MDRVGKSLCQYAEDDLVSVSKCSVTESRSRRCWLVDADVAAIGKEAERCVLGAVTLEEVQRCEVEHIVALTRTFVFRDDQSRQPCRQCWPPEAHCVSRSIWCAESLARPSISSTYGVSTVLKIEWLGLKEEEAAIHAVCLRRRRNEYEENKRSFS